MDSSIFCKALEKRIGRPLEFSERQTVNGYLSRVTLNSLTSLNLAYDFHLAKVAKQFEVNEIDKVNEIDLKEYQKKMLGDKAESSDLVAITAEIESLLMLGSGDIYDLAKSCAPKSQWKYNYIMLDSDNCFDINNNRDTFTWLLEDKVPRLQKGYINLHSNLRNIVAARIGRMSMNHQSMQFTDEAINRNRFAFGFEEFTSQALITPSGTKFQFAMFLPEYDEAYGTNVTLTAFNTNRGWFRFRERYLNLDKLTLTITNLNTGNKFTLGATNTVIPAVQYRGPVAVTGVLILDSPVEVPFRYLPINFRSKYGLETDTEAPVAETFIFGGISTGNPVIDADYNGAERTLVWDAENYFSFVGYSFPTGAPATYPVTITLTYKPRFTGVLELISEDNNDIKSV